jgi:transcription elongation factor/antiterminator RfaH
MGKIDGSMNSFYDGPLWYVAYTKPRSEDLVQRELQKKGILVFLPKIRTVKFRKSRLQKWIQPLFPNYLFARFTYPDAYDDVRWTRGLRRIIGNGDRPIPLDDSVVLFLRTRTDGEGLIKPKSRDPKVGDMVRVSQGPFEGLFGVVDGQIDPKGRIRILMDILHSRVKVKLPYSYLQKHE